MLHDVLRAPERCQHVDEPEQLDLEMLIPHREGHHPLVKAGFRENGLGFLVNQFENPLAPPLDLALQRTHGAILRLPLRFGKDRIN